MAGTFARNMGIMAVLDCKALFIGGISIMMFSGRKIPKYLAGKEVKGGRC
jgi:hypothetical protein